MSNNNSFWAKRFGYIHKDGTLALVCSGFGGTSRTPPKDQQKNRKPPDDVKQSNRDKALYEYHRAANPNRAVNIRGLAIVEYGPTGRRIGI